VTVAEDRQAAAGWNSAVEMAMTDHLPGDTPLAELKALAKITPGDIEHAKAAFRKHARPGAKDLLNAVPLPAQKLKKTRKPSCSRPRCAALLDD
jgi:hypothetical protein